jgi:hypothetical protein
VDRPSLRQVILRKVDDGTLPTKAPNKVYSGYGSGAACDVCGDTILRVQVEYELNYPDERRTFRLQLRRAVGSGALDARPRSRVVTKRGSTRPIPSSSGSWRWGDARARCTATHGVGSHAEPPTIE